MNHSKRNYRMTSDYASIVGLSTFCSDDIVSNLRMTLHGGLSFITELPTMYKNLEVTNIYRVERHGYDYIAVNLGNDSLVLYFAVTNDIQQIKKGNISWFINNHQGWLQGFRASSIRDTKIQFELDYHNSRL